MKYFFKNREILPSEKTFLRKNYKYLNFDKYTYNLGYSNTIKVPLSINANLFEYINKINSTSRLNTQEVELIVTDTPFGNIKEVGLIKSIDKENLSINTVDYDKKIFDLLKSTKLKDLDYSQWLSDTGSSDWCGTTIANYFHPDYIFYTPFINGKAESNSYEQTISQTDYYVDVVHNFIRFEDKQGVAITLKDLMLYKSNAFIRISFIIEAIETYLGLTVVDNTANKFTDFCNTNYLSIKSYYELYNEKYGYYNTTNMAGKNVGDAFPSWSILDFIKSIALQNSCYFTCNNGKIEIRKIKDLLLPSNILELNNIFHSYSKIDKNFAHKTFRKTMLLNYDGRSDLDLGRAIAFEFNEEFQSPKKTKGDDYFKFVYGETKEMLLETEKGDDFGTFGSLQKFFESDHVIIKLTCNTYDYRILELNHNEETVIEVEEFSENFQNTVDTEFLDLLAGMYDYGNRITFKGYIDKKLMNQLRLPFVAIIDNLGKFYIDEIKYKEKADSDIIATQIKPIKANIITY